MSYVVALVQSLHSASIFRNEKLLFHLKISSGISYRILYWVLGNQDHDPIGMLSKLEKLSLMLEMDDNIFLPSMVIS